MNNPKNLITLTRQFLVKHNRYMASANMGRLKEMNVAKKELEAELDKFPKEEQPPVMDSVTKLF